METSEIVIRRPTAKFRPKESAPVFDLGKPIRGMRVGIRTDAFWRSWLDVADEWVEQLRRDGAEPVLVKVGEHTGEEGQYTKDILEAWADSVDCAVVGLAN